MNQAQFTNIPRDLIHVYYLMETREEEYTYDPIGNRKTEKVTQRYPVARTYVYYENSSRLKSNGKYTFEYDSNGNLIKKETISGEKITWKYEYDLFNRLVKVTKNDNVVAEYIYDEAGLRIKKVSPKSQIYYVFDTGGNVIYEQENQEYMAYIHILGKHFARIDGNLGNGITNKYFYHTDHLGSTVLVTDEQGNQVWSAEFSPFGKQNSVNGSLDHVTQFTGKDLDEDIGLYYFNARWYDQETGRFISEDQVIDPNNFNLYAYCANNPLTNVDPSGNSLIKFSLNDIINMFKGLFGKKSNKNQSSSSNSKQSSQQTTSNNTTTDNNQYHGAQPSGEPVGYKEFPGPPPVKFPIYKIDQLPESERWKYTNQIDSSDQEIMYIPPGMENAKISEHFTISEFMSDVAGKNSTGDFIKDANGKVLSVGKDRFIRLDPNLVGELEKIRAENGGRPMLITEGFRSIEWQNALAASGYDTAGRSPHTAGIAADFVIIGVRGKAVQDNILNRIQNGTGTGRVGKGVNWTHFDIADTVYGTSWYDKTTKFAPGATYKTGRTWGYSY